MGIIRPDYWSKNIFIVISYLFTLQIFDGSFINLNITELVIIFISFSILTSSCYVINEYLDKDEDRFHPEKKKRQLISSKINGFKITIIHFILLTVSLLILYHPLDIIRQNLFSKYQCLFPKLYFLQHRYLLPSHDPDYCI